MGTCRSDVGTHPGILLVLLLALFLAPEWTGAQRIWVAQYVHQADLKVYEVAYPHQADLKVYITTNSSRAGHQPGWWYLCRYAHQADIRIFLVPYSHSADVRIYYVSHPHLAGWTNNTKCYPSR